MNIDSRYINLADACIDSMTKLIEKTPDFEKLFDFIKENPMNYNFQHCLLNTYLSNISVFSMSWRNKEQPSILIFVFFP